jgi:hypothetical protein
MEEECGWSSSDDTSTRAGDEGDDVRLVFDRYGGLCLGIAHDSCGRSCLPVGSPPGKDWRRQEAFGTGSPKRAWYFIGGIADYRDWVCQRRTIRLVARGRGSDTDRSGPCRRTAARAPEYRSCLLISRVRTRRAMWPSTTAIQPHLPLTTACGPMSPHRVPRTSPTPPHRTGRAVLPHPALGLGSRKAHEVTTHSRGSTGAARTPN